MAEKEPSPVDDHVLDVTGPLVVALIEKVEFEQIVPEEVVMVAVTGCPITIVTGSERGLSQ